MTVREKEATPQYPHGGKFYDAEGISVMFADGVVPVPTGGEYALSLRVLYRKAPKRNLYFCQWWQDVHTGRSSSDVNGGKPEVKA